MDKLWILISVFSLQDTSAAGVKRAKCESWEKSVGTLGGRGALGSLVVRKKAVTPGNKPVVKSTSTASTSQTGNILNLLLHLWTFT